MASRRLRIKPIANVPVRRGKIDDSVRSGTLVENGKKETEVSSTISVDEESQGNDIFRSKGSEKHISVSTAGTSSQSSEGDVKVDNDPESVNSQTVPECRKSNDLLESNTEVDTNISVTSKNTAIMCGTSLPPNNVPPGLARKRVKPAVSISAATRRPRDSNNILNSEKTDGPTLTDNNCNKIAPQESVRSSFRNENISVTFPSHSDMDTDTLSSGGKDIGVGVPGIAQIPTGTAIRPQHDSNIDVPTYLDGNGEAPQSLPEPDLPSEGAGIGNNDIMLKSSFSQASLMQRSRFIRPNLDLSMHRHKLGVSGASNSESEDKNKSQIIDINSSQNVCGKMLPDRTRAVPNFIASQGRTTEDKPENSVESDEELRESSSELNICASPVKKSMETSRGRFARPIPRLVEASVRRNSIQNSASESEEESKKGSYQCSTTSLKKQADIDSEDVSTAANNDTNPEEHEKKIARARRTPSSCMQKMAKARQEFQTKFGNRRPDRSRLTMFDLIFYNPTTNPMKTAEDVNNSAKYSQAKDSTECIIEERLEEEQVDEPAVQEEDQNNGNAVEVEEEEDEEAMAMPVPQVKVGPDGQIILDEKSLVIETTGAKKNREDLANSAVIVDYGTGSTGYGTYSSKKKKYKEWSKQETLKFYRALNTVGTDFLLMQSIFPNRTRQDLKVKFKKEDRMNRFLVEKALRYPLDFDLTELEKDLEKEQEEERQKKLAKLQFPKPKPQSSNAKKQKKSVKNKGIKKSFLFAAMDPSDTGEVRRVTKRNIDSSEVHEKEKITAKHPRKNLKVKSEEVVNSSSSSDEENELEFNYNDDLRFSTEIETKSKSVEHKSGESDNDLDELEYLTRPRKPTRSGRIPQPRKLDEIDDLLESKLEKESNMLVTANNSVKTVPENHPLPLEDLTNIEPGSLVVLATQSPTNPGHQVYKVFMVAPSSSGLPVGSTMTPVTVPSQILQKLSSSDTAVTPNACNELNNESQSACASSADCLPTSC